MSHDETNDTRKGQPAPAGATANLREIGFNLDELDGAAAKVANYLADPIPADDLQAWDDLRLQTLKIVAYLGRVRREYDRSIEDAQVIGMRLARAEGDQ